MLNNISDIKNVFYINLESRTDRKKLVEKELDNLDLVGTRFNAIKLSKYNRNQSEYKIWKTHYKRNANHCL